MQALGGRRCIASAHSKGRGVSNQWSTSHPGSALRPGKNETFFKVNNYKHDGDKKLRFFDKFNTDKYAIKYQNKILDRA